MNRYRLNVNVSIQPEPGSGQSYGNLQVQENVSFEASNFMEVAAMLGRFHEMAAKLRSEYVQEDR